MKRVITTNDAEGRSRVLLQEQVDGNALVWETRPGEPLGAEPRPGAHDLDFPKGQILARYIEIPADAVLEQYLQAGIPGVDEHGFHRTGTLDFVVLLEGQLTLLLDAEEVQLQPGDVVVQRDTNHAWRAGSAPARCLAIISQPDADA